MDNPGAGAGTPSPDISSLEEMAGLGGGAGIGSVLGSTPGSASGSALPPQTAPAQTPPAAREVGTVVEELVTRPLEDMRTEVTQIFSLSRLLGVENPTDSPEQKAKKQQLHQRFNQLSQAEQEAAERRYQREAARKQAQAEEDARSEQAKAAAAAQSVPAPSGPSHGQPTSGRSQQQAAAQQLEQDRKASLSKLQTAG